MKTTIKYFDGKKVIEIEVDAEMAVGYEKIKRECDRSEWRQDKRIERHHAKISLDQMSEDVGYQPESLTVANPLEGFVAREERQERKVKLDAVLADLTPEQKALVRMLKKGMSVTEIADKLGVGKTAVSNMRIRIQEKIKKYLR